MRSGVWSSAVAGLGLASTAFGGFTVSATMTASGPFSRVDIIAINTGGNTGTQIKGLEYFYSGAPAYFQVDDTDEDAIPDTVNLLSTSRTRIRVSANAFDNVFVGVSPTNGSAQPNPYEGGVTDFQGAIANTGITQATGAGFQIARLFIPQSAGFNWVFSGNLGGDVGSKVPFVVRLAGPPTQPPVIDPIPPVDVVFGQVVTGGAPFTAQVRVTSSTVGDVVSLSLGALPATVRNVVVSPASGASPHVFTVTGIVDYAANGTDVLIPVIATSAASAVPSTGSITLRVTPEPATLLSMTAVLPLMRRRR